MILGTIFYVVGGVTATSSDRYGFSGFFIAGIVLTTSGAVLFAIVSVLIQVRRVGQLRKAVAEESSKYSTRSPIPCSWRLETANRFFGRYSNRSRERLTGHVSPRWFARHFFDYLFQIIIDIGRPMVQGNGVYFTQQGVNNVGMFSGVSDPSAPPPYSNQLGEVCVQCGVPRVDLRAKFCSSCGHSFEKHWIILFSSTECCFEYIFLTIQFNTNLIRMIMNKICIQLILNSAWKIVDFLVCVDIHRNVEEVFCNYCLFCWS